MKPFIISAILLLLIGKVLAQYIPEYGKINLEELTMKSCDFDKNAEALILFDMGEFRSKPGFNILIQQERHVRIKILTDKGLDRANVHINYQSFNDNEIVQNISAQTYNLDAAGNMVVSKLDTSQLYKKEVNTRWTELSFTLPEVRVGSVIEYKYTIAGAGSCRWYFQRSIPVKLSKFTINFPTEYEMGIMPHTFLSLKSDTVKQADRHILVYSMENVPPLLNEPFILSEEDYLQRIDARIISHNPFGFASRSYVRTWPDVIQSLMADEDFGVQLKKNVPRTRELDNMLKNMADPYKKMVTIHDYVRKNMQWNGYDNIWANRGVKSAWRDKKGTSGEINLILVNLLKDADLDAHPVLVSTKSNGRVNPNIASSRQFNKVMAYVELKGKKYVLDATEKITPSRLIPLEIMATDGMVIEKIETNEWGWKTMWDEAEMFSNTVIITGNIDKDGLMKGEADIASVDYARVRRMPLLNQGKDAFVEYFFTPDNENIKIDSVVFENEHEDSLPLLQHVIFNKTLNSSGDYRYFSANMFAGLEKNPFLADTRFSDIFFGYKQHITLVGNFIIPDGYEFEELPKNMRMIMPDTGIVFTRLSSLEGRLLSVKITLDFRKPIYTIEEYPDFKEYCKKLFLLLNEQFVFRKKN